MEAQSNSNSHDVDSVLENNPPTIAYSNRKQFQYNGRVYLTEPSLEEFLVEAGVNGVRIFRAVLKSLLVKGITSIEGLRHISKSQILHNLEGNVAISNKIFNHLLLIKHKGSLLLELKDLEQFEKDYYYLEMIKEIDKHIFKHANGRYGIRSKSVIELCGPDGVGKTQWCLTATCSMLQVGKKVLYVDSEGGFNYHRIIQIAKDTHLSKRSIKDNIILSHIDSFDELDAVIDEVSAIIKDNNIGMIVIDSLLRLLQNSYPITTDKSLNALAERQLHLRRTMRRLRSIARLHNLIIIYSNLTRDRGYRIPLNFSEDGLEEDEEDLTTLTKLVKRLVWLQTPMGGSTLAQSSDIRLFLEKNSKDPNSFKIKVENCSYLPRASVNYLITEHGIKTANLDTMGFSKEHIDEMNDLLS